MEVYLQSAGLDSCRGHQISNYFIYLDKILKILMYDTQVLHMRILIMSLAMHLTRRSGGVYYYRQRIPRQISAHYENRKEICFSLNTKEPSEAKQLSYAYSLKYSQEFDRYNKQIQSNSSNQFHCSSAHRGMNGSEGKE